MSKDRRQPSGMFGFTIVWFGQLVSLLGTSMTQFALTIWAWQKTGSATALALMAFFAFGPSILVSPFAGALVDRWNRKRVMILSDIGAGLSTGAILLLYTTGHLEIWHLYVAGALAGIFQAFQFPAYAAAITTMVAREHLGRANGMLSLVFSLSDIAAPFLGGALVLLIGIGGVITIDMVTFVIAVAALALVHVPQPATTAEGAEGSGSLLQEAGYGFRYIVARPPLLGLQLVFMALNVMGGLYMVLLSPMILARTGQSVVLGTVLSATGVGAVAGGLLLTAWGGPKRRVRGVLGFMVAVSLLGVVTAGLGRSLWLWVPAAFCWGLISDLLNGTSQAIWQTKVAPDVQGRVFATRRLIAQILAPQSQLAAGPLADRVFEPALQPGGALGGLFGGLLGTGPGAGIALILVLAGLFGALVGIAGFLVPVVRNAETILPDCEVEPMEA